MILRNAGNGSVLFGCFAQKAGTPIEDDKKPTVTGLSLLGPLLEFMKMNPKEIPKLSVPEYLHKILRLTSSMEERHQSASAVSEDSFLNLNQETLSLA
ncbi:hypothetical protein K1719_010872 [Acacia pycnantha]|nr:hypothetical protein K1719_010872 [Acacia pycnantha]